MHGIKEGSNENCDEWVTDVLSESMAETITIQDSDGTQGLPGKKSNGKSRLVNVKFAHYNTRNLIYKNKKA